MSSTPTNRDRIYGDDHRPFDVGGRPTGIEAGEKAIVGPVENSHSRPFAHYTRARLSSAPPALCVTSDRSEHHVPGMENQRRGTMAIVQREMQMSRPSSSLISIDQTCDERPTCTGTAVAVTTPSDFERR